MLWNLTGWNIPSKGIWTFGIWRWTISIANMCQFKNPVFSPMKFDWYMTDYLDQPSETWTKSCCDLDLMQSHSGPYSLNRGNTSKALKDLHLHKKSSRPIIAVRSDNPRSRYRAAYSLGPTMNIRWSYIFRLSKLFILHPVLTIKITYYYPPMI